MNTKNTITLSKVVKVPVPGVQFSNQQVGIEIVYEAEGFDVLKATDELNQMLTIVRENEPSWIHQLSLNEAKKQETENKQRV